MFCCFCGFMMSLFFCLCSDMLQNGLIWAWFHHGHGMTPSDIEILEIVYVYREHCGLLPAVSCQNLHLVFNTETSCLCCPVSLASPWTIFIRFLLILSISFFCKYSHVFLFLPLSTKNSTLLNQSIPCVLLYQWTQEIFPYQYTEISHAFFFNGCIIFHCPDDLRFF